jgi:hypothetical protein
MLWFSLRPIFWEISLTPMCVLLSLHLLALSNAAVLQRLAGWAWVQTTTKWFFKTLVRSRAHTNSSLSDRRKECESRVRESTQLVSDILKCPSPP